jgi:hypothetical protein
MSSILNWQRSLGAPFKPYFGVKFQDILYILSPDILYSFIFQPPLGGKVGNARRFPRRQSRRLFLPCSGLGNPLMDQGRLAGGEIQLPYQSGAVVDQNTLFHGDNLHPLLAEGTTKVPLQAVYMEFSVRVDLA